MKNKPVLILAVTTLALAGVCFIQWQKLGAQKTQISSLRAETEQSSRQIDELQAAQERAEQQRRDSPREASAPSPQLQLQQLIAARASAMAATNALPTVEKPTSEAGKAGFGEILSKMMDDPDMKKFIRDQQRQTMDTLYGPLVKQMGLTPEEADKFKDFLADNMMKSTEKATSMLGSLSGSNRTDAVSSLVGEQKSMDDQVKAFLGDARYAQYKDYQQTLGERSQLTTFKQQSGGNSAPLTDPQTEQLLTFMKEEKLTVAAATGQLPPTSDQSQANNLQAMLSSDQTEKALQSQTLVNERVYDRAKAVLSPDQLEAFGKFQANQLQITRMGMTMARKLIMPDKPADGSTPPR